MHGRIGAALEQLCGDSPERLEDDACSATISASAPSARRARSYLMAAGDRARAIYANDDAIRLYQQALTVLRPRRTRCRKLALARADCRSVWTVRPARHRDRTLSDRPGLLSETGDRRRSAHAAQDRPAAVGWRQTRAGGGPRMPRRPRCWRERTRRSSRRICFRNAGPSRSASAITRAPRNGPMMRSVASACRQSRPGRTRAGGSARDCRSPQHQGRRAGAAGTQPGCRARGGAKRRGCRSCRPAQRRLSRLHQSRRALQHHRPGTGDGGLPARARGRASHRRSRLSGAAAGQPRGRQLHLHERCPTEGVPAAEKAIEIDRALDQREHLPVPLIVLGQIHQCHGQPELAVRFYNEALEVAQETGEPQQLFPCYDGLATLNLDQDNLPEAERYLHWRRMFAPSTGLIRKR